MCVRACQTALKSPWKGILGGRPNFHVFSITVEKLRPRGYSGLLSGTQWVNSRRLGRLAGCIGVEKKMQVCSDIRALHVVYMMSSSHGPLDDTCNKSTRP